MAGSADLHLPVTGAFALPFAGYFIFLSERVGLARIAHQVALGDRVPSSSSSSPPASASASSDGPASSPHPLNPAPGSNDPLLQVTRAHQNFAENVPLALLLAAVAELNGASRGRLAGLLGALLAFRVLHAELGIMRRDGMGIGRRVGFFGTIGVVAWLGSWSTWLVFRG
ncbi:membrane-associated, eicosanoid/glutathione metabolism protein [Hypoxylon fuscum]|nr:membrane-associated, eicosanoid/glutathione metabolism protein [Hypoxylon fuscum]